MNSLEYRLASLVLRVLGRLFDLLPGHPERVVLATARLDVLEGNLLGIHDAIRRLRPDLRPVLLLEPYGYGLAAKARYLLRVVRGLYHVRTAGLVVVDNAYLPIHVAPHRRRTTVVQVWHAAGALKRFGVDTVVPPAEPEATFLHRYYDYVIAAGEQSREPWSRALRTPVERVLPLGAPRTDVFFDPDAVAARARSDPGRVPDPPGPADRALRADVPRSWPRSHRGHGARRRRACASSCRRRGRWSPRPTPTSIRPRSRRPASTSWATPGEDLNDWLAVADVLVTDYSSAIFEWSLLRRPLVLLVDDLEAYERDPGLYLDYRTEMIGTQVRDTDAVAEAVLAGEVDPGGVGCLHRPAHGILRRPRQRALRGAVPARGPGFARGADARPERGAPAPDGGRPGRAHSSHGYEDHPGRRHRHR